MNDTGHMTAFETVNQVSNMTIETAPLSQLSQAELSALAGWIAANNDDPTSHVGYVGVDSEQVLAELADMEDGAMVAHAISGDQRRGLMMAEWDPTTIRVWLHGPWTDDEAVADAMFAALAVHIPERNTEHEVFCDERNSTVMSFAHRRGLESAGGTNVLRVGREHFLAEPDNVIVGFEPKYLDAFARLHRRVHPDAHRTADQVVADDVPLLIALDGETVLGYATSTVVPGSAIGSIEHVGVDPDLPHERWVSVYRDVLAASTRRLFSDASVTDVEIVARPERTPLLNEFGFGLFHAMRAYRATGGA